MGECQSFPLFSAPTFPPEIQDLIWQHAIDNTPPRQVSLRYTPPKTTNYSNTLLYTSASPIPALLHACSCSRALTLKRWRLAFAYQTKLPKIFFDFQRDTLFFGLYFTNMSLFLTNDKKEVRKVASVFRDQVRSVRGSISSASLHMVAKMLFTDFPILEHIGLVSEDSDEGSGHVALVETIGDVDGPDGREGLMIMDTGIIKHYSNLKEHLLKIKLFRVRRK